MMTIMTQHQKQRFVKCIANDGDSLSLTPGQFYRVLPDKAEAHSMLRVVDNTGEDYLFDAVLFENVNDLSGWLTDLTVNVTIPMKATIRQLANQRGVSMAALVREWIDERLDLPAMAG
jgi:uncharacterized protein with ATP-grasp and redox domains